MTTTTPIHLAPTREVRAEGLVARRIAVDPFDPWRLLAAVPQHKSYRLFAEPDGPLRLGVGAAARVARAPGDKDVPWSVLFEALRASLGSLGELARAHFTAAFDHAHPFADEQHWRGFAPVELCVPDLHFERVDGAYTLTVVAPETDIDRAVETGRALLKSALVERTNDPSAADIVWNDDAYGGAVQAALDQIARGVAQKIVVARPIDVARHEGAFSVPALIADLERRFPSCFLFAHRPGGSHRGAAPTFLGASPERLVSVEGDVVQTGAIAGTAPRGVSARMDQRHANELLKSDKEQREHEVVGDMIVGALEPFCDTVERHEMRFLKLANVQHLWTPISGTLSEGRTLLDVAQALHPTPAVGGEPRKPAIAAIRDIEPWARGLYAGVVGSVGLDGSGELAVAIRSALVDGGDARVFAGAGIVEGSLPQSEVDETRSKSRAILDSLERS